MTSSSSSSSSREKKVDVIIIGAGMSGLAAADHLFSNGIDNFIVLEASDRYGGRLYTAPYGEAYLEHGANWIHGGSEENDLFKLARQNALLSNDESVVPQRPLLEDRTHGLFYTSLGQAIDSQLGHKCYQLFFEAEMNATRHYRFDHRTKKRLATKSLLDFLEEEWLRLVLREFPDAGAQEREHADAIFRSMLLYFRSHVGDDLSLVPTILHGTFENVAGEDVIMPAGMRALIDQFYVRLPKNAIFYDTTVTDIFWQPTEAPNAEPKADKWQDYPVKIITDSGLQWRAKHVIATLPLGVLKRSHDKIFHPPLPPLKVQAIESLGFSQVEKVFLEFERPFWQPGFGGIKLAWTAKDFEEKLLPRDWFKVICSFDEVYRQPNILAAWVSGREAQVMLSLSDHDILSTCSELLRRFTSNPHMEAPVRIIRTNWLNNPLFGGSYSYHTFDSSPRSFSDLAAPLPSEKQPHLLFAGEATHDHYYSTLHAAYITGLREADRIIPLLNKMPNLKHKL